jgi:hypothetical protein
MNNCFDAIFNDSIDDLAQQTAVLNADISDTYSVSSEATSASRTSSSRSASPVVVRQVKARRSRSPTRSKSRNKKHKPAASPPPPPPAPQQQPEVQSTDEMFANMARRAEALHNRDGGGGGGFSDTTNNNTNNNTAEPDRITGVWKKKPQTEKIDWGDHQDDPACALDPTYCFFCETQETDSQMEKFPILMLFKKTVHNYYGRMTRKIFALQSLNAFNKHVLDRTDNKKPMRAAVILEHFEVHAPLEIVHLQQVKHSMMSYLRVLQNQVQEVDEATNEMRIDKQSLATYTMVADKISSLMAQIAKLGGE